MTSTLLDKIKWKGTIALAPIEINKLTTDSINRILNNHGYQIYDWLHITILQFSRQENVAIINEQLPSIASSFHPFYVDLVKLSSFMDKHVIYLELANTQELNRLRNIIISHCTPHMLASDTFSIPNTPHISVAYVNKRDYAEIANSTAELHVQESILLESIALRDWISMNRVFKFKQKA